MIVANEFVVHAHEIVHLARAEPVAHRHHIRVRGNGERPVHFPADARATEKRGIESPVPRFAVIRGQVVAVAVNPLVGELAECGEQVPLVGMCGDADVRARFVFDGGFEAGGIGVAARRVQCELRAHVGGESGDGDNCPGF